MTVAEPKSKRWTRAEYYRLAEEGWFSGQRVQLINGEILQMAPQGHRHSYAVGGAGELLTAAFGPRHWIRMQMPLDASDVSSPEPDIAVAEFERTKYRDHPITAILVVEISDSSLRLDRRKAGLYAAARVPEYWIVNLEDRRLEVFTQPAADAKSEFGHSYTQHRELSETDTVHPIAGPDTAIPVKSFFE